MDKLSPLMIVTIVGSLLTIGCGSRTALEEDSSVNQRFLWERVSQQTGFILPDGGIAVTYRSHSWQQPGVAISYDQGQSFSYLLGGPNETINAFVTAADEFVVFTAVSHRSDASAGAYRWVPGE